MIVRYPGSRWRLFAPIILVVGIFVSGLLLLTNVVKAEVSLDDISWTDAPPTTYSSEVVSDTDPGLCPDFYQTKEISGYSDLKKICMTSGESARAGIYRNRSLYNLAVGFRFDTKMYKVNGVCWYINECRYLPGSNALVVTQKMSGNATSLIIYKNFTHRLKANIKENVISRLEYDFDTSNPDYTFKRANGTLWLTGSIGVSENGDWLAVELMQNGVGLLNVKTLEMRRISAAPFYYGYGMDPTVEFAVSNDGKHVAVMGMNAGIAVYDVNSECGEPVTDDNSWMVGYMVQSCKKAQIDIVRFIDNFKDAIQPKFDDNGGELSFFAFSYVDPSHYVALRANGYVRPRLDYLALGDSFTSGEGETDDNYYLNGTNDEYDKCHLSTRSYPYVIADVSNIDPAFMRSVACSGAKTEDVIGDEGVYFGQGDRFGESQQNLSDSDIMLSKVKSLYSFVPGRVLQSRFVKEYKPKVITVGIGGNDAGFMDILKTCIMPGTCEAAGTAEGREKMATEIKSIFEPLVETYNNIHTASPDSKIFAIGYPKIISENVDCKTAGKVFNNTERQFMNEGIKYLNEVIAAAAKSAGVKYVDVYDAYGEHILCGNESDSAVGAIRSGDDMNIINDSRWFRFVGNESFHPNQLGHFMLAGTVLGSVGNIMEYKFCDNGNVVCPDETVVAPEPSTYWVPEVYHGYPAQISINFATDRGNTTNGLQKQIRLMLGSLLPNSSVEIVLKSDPVSLGTFTVSDDGSLNVGIDLPAEFEEGYHTIHIYGTSYSGESIELYQVIKYEKPYITEVPPNPIDIINDTNNTTDIPAVELVDPINDIEVAMDESDMSSNNVVKVEIVNSATNTEVVTDNFDTSNNNVVRNVVRVNTNKIIATSDIMLAEKPDVNMISEPTVKGVAVVANKLPVIVKNISNDNSLIFYCWVIGIFISMIVLVIFRKVYKLRD